MRVPSLPEFQRVFASGIFSGDSGVLDWIKTPTTRFDIYRSSVLANFCNALREVYPVVLRLTGEQFFDQVADRFARESPSNSGDLHHYGELFPGFLAVYAPAKKLYYLADVAQLEWLWHEAFHAADAPVLDLSALAAIPPADYDRLHFHLQPGCRLFRSPFPVLQIWEANQPTNIAVKEINLEDGPENLILYRTGFEVVIARLSVAEYALVESLGTGAALGTAIARVIELESEIDAGAALQRLAVQGIVCGFAVA